jgi:hypothetical protein
MKRAVLAALLVVTFGLSFAAAAPEGIGLGFIGGEPSGLSAKKWLSDRTAFDAALAWSYWGYGALHIHADFLWHTKNMIQDANGFLPLYIGVGGRVKLANDVSETQHPLRVGVRIPLGAEYVFTMLPVGVFLEVVPIFNVVPNTAFDWNSAAGIRYYFGSKGG